VPTAKWLRYQVSHPPFAHLSPTTPFANVGSPLVLLAANCTAIIVHVVVAAADMAAFCFHLRLRLVWFWPLPSAGSPNPPTTHSTPYNPYHPLINPSTDQCMYQSLFR